MAWRDVMVAALLLSACKGSGGSGGGDGGIDRDGGGESNIVGTTYSPTICQADIELHEEAEDNVIQHPVAYKGDYFDLRDVPTPGGDKLALVSLRTGDVMALTGQTVAGFAPDEELTLLDAAERAVTPDLGQENAPDYPLAFMGAARNTLSESRRLLLRSDGKGALQIELSQGQNVTIPRSPNFVLPLPGASGVVESFDRLRLGPEGQLVFELHLEDNPTTYLVRQDKAGGGFELLVAQGDPLKATDPEDPRTAGPIQRLRISHFADVLMNMDVMDALGQREGFAEFSMSMQVPDYQCLATNGSVDCSGVLVNNENRLAEDGFGGDGAAFGGVLVTPAGTAELHYKVLDLPVTSELVAREPVQGHTIDSFGRPRVCTSKNRLYFVGTLYDPEGGRRDEVFRIEETGAISQLTDFGSLLADPALEGEVPDEIVDWEFGYNCDAVLYAWGPSGPDSSIGYEGYWAVYDSGEVMEILDETPDRPNNGNGELTSVERARSGLDPNADDEDVVNIGPEGEFYFLTRRRRGDGSPYRQYVVATKPAAGCDSN